MKEIVSRCQQVVGIFLFGKNVLLFQLFTPCIFILKHSFIHSIFSSFFVGLSADRHLCASLIDRHVCVSCSSDLFVSSHFVLVILSILVSFYWRRTSAPWTERLSHTALSVLSVNARSYNLHHTRLGPTSIVRRPTFRIGGLTRREICVHCP